MKKFSLLFISLFLMISSVLAEESLHTQYVRALEPWIPAAKSQIRFLDDQTAIYGLAQHGHWYMQAHDTAFCAFAVLGTDPETNEQTVGMTREELRRTALAMLRFTLRSHLAGGGACTDGIPWGHTWISPLGLERMSAGVEALEPYMDAELKELYAKVYASEADYLLTLEIVAGLVQNNVPESNMWKGAALWRAAALNPDSPNAGAWREKARKYFINSMSTPSDEKNEAVYDGKRVCDQFVGANMFDSRACDHHGYQNVGYMNITLSNLALIHFWCKDHNVPAPESLYFNALEQWKLVKACMFDDGRLLRVGGDTRVRYCYCQDYAIFVWMLAQDQFGDREAAKFERGWIPQVVMEQKASPDGWFMKDRLATLWDLSPLYFTRLEGDKACTLATAACWHRVIDFEKIEAKNVPALTAWHDDYHGAWLQKGPKRIASWVWNGAWKAGGLCIPTDGSDLAEWQSNLAGCVFGVGQTNIAIPQISTGFQFDGGFATCGKSRINSPGSLAEGDHSPDVGALYSAFVALPDDQTVVTIQRARAGMSNYLRKVRGLALSIPNDVFNGFQRTYFTADGTQTLRSNPGKFELIPNSGKWLNVDEKLGVVEIYGGTPKIARPAKPQVVIQHSGHPAMSEGFLYCDEIAQEANPDVRFIGDHEVIFDCAAVVLTANAQKTREFAEAGNAKQIPSDDPVLRLVSVKAADGVTYYIAVNFSDETKPFDPNKAFGKTGLKPMGETPETLSALGIGVWR
ncbi:MAG: hypothetical protein IJU53_13345 [Thermoguttaceae bacterium]|nr:hypothetical protein [Thermoguttaceae bacterium]